MDDELAIVDIEVDTVDDLVFPVEFLDFANIDIGHDDSLS